LRARLTEQEVRKIIKAYFGRYPEIPAWHDANYDQASTLGYVQTIPLGRRRWFPIAPPPYTEIANWPIQTAGSDIVTMEMIQIQYELKRRFKDAWIILHAHDALAIECYESDAEEVAALVNLLFGNTRIEGPAGVVILTAKAKIGKSLKDVK
jgi:DNA polymerase I-like protein with 3'-5' exonuclease and polymerase domains